MDWDDITHTIGLQKVADMAAGADLYPELRKRERGFDPSFYISACAHMQL